MSTNSLLRRADRLAERALPQCRPYLMASGEDLTERHICPRCGGCHAIVIEEIIVMPDGKEVRESGHMAYCTAVQTEASPS